MKKYLIAGNGVAAAGCIEGIRSVDAENTIIVISEENHDVYCRPLISYYLEGKTDLPHMQYRDPSFYEKMGVQVLYEKKAQLLDPENHLLILDDDTKLEYDSLCIATGSAPFVPPFTGLDTVPEKYSFMTLDDALALEKAVTPASRILIIGAGLIGLKCAEGLCARAGSITVCDLADRVLSSILDMECASIMQKHLEENKISFLLNDSVKQFDGTKAIMESGTSIEFDILVLAVGVRPNTGLLKDIEGAVNRGILVNGKMETALPGIYAAGDCTEGDDVSSGQKKILAILPNAYMQGHAAGVNMAGGSEEFDKGLPMNSIGFFGLHAMTAGTYEGDLYEERSEDSIKRLFTKDDCLKGFMLIGRNERAGIYTSLIREKTPLSSIDFDVLKESASTLCYSSDIRKQKFGGVV